MKPEFLVIGRSARPTTGSELEQLLRPFLSDDIVDGDGSVEGLDRATISAAMRDPDVTSLVVDLTDVSMRFEDHPVAPTDPDRDDTADATPDEPPPVLRTRAAHLVRGTIRAHPILLQGVPVSIDATAENVSFEWAELEGGFLGIRIGGGKRRMGGRRRRPLVRLRAGTDVGIVARTVAGLARAEARNEGIQIDREHLKLKSLGHRRLRIEASARVRKRWFRGTYTLRTTLTINRHNVARLSRTRITSRNPLTHLGLRVLRSRINKEIQQPVKLDEIMAHWSIQDIRIRAGRRLEVDVRLLAPS